MPRLARAPSTALVAFARGQAGAVSRSQAKSHGFTDGQIEAMLAGQRWQTHLPGVYLTFTGAVPPRARVWGAVLYAGAGATASLGTAAWLWGLREDLPARIEICVPFERKVTDQPGVRVVSRKYLDEQRHPVQLPPRTRVEDTVLDLLDHATDEDEVVALITSACQRRLTTAGRLGQRASDRNRLRWRRLIGEVLADVAAGVQSALERRYARIERAHGLPIGTRNQAEGRPGRRRHRDVRYRRYAVVVELDGNAAHPTETASSTVLETTTSRKAPNSPCGTAGSPSPGHHAPPPLRWGGCWPRGAGRDAFEGAVQRVPRLLHDLRRSSDSNSDDDRRS